MTDSVKTAADRAYHALDALVEAKAAQATYTAVRDSTVALYWNDARPAGAIICVAFEHPHGDLDILKKVSLARLVREVIKDGASAEECESIAEELEVLARKLRRNAR